MNDRQLQKKVHKDVEQVKKDVGILMRDSAARIHVGNGGAPKDLLMWAQSMVSQLSKDLEKVTDSAVDTVASAATTMKKDLGQQLNKTNSSSRKFMAKTTDNLGKTVSKNPWVVISAILAIGLILGSVVRPIRQIHA